MNRALASVTGSSSPTYGLAVQLPTGAATRRLDRVRIRRELLGATLPLQCATGNRGGCTIAGGSLEADGEPAEGPAVEALDGRRGEVRIRD